MHTHLPLACLLLSASVAAPLSAQFTAQRRAVAADTLFVDVVFGEADTDSDAASTLAPGPFAADVEADAGAFGSASYADADQTSDVDLAAGTFSARGNAAAGLYVQGQGDANAVSLLELEFALVGPGSLTLDGELFTGEAFEGFSSQDPHAASQVALRVEDADTGAVLFQSAVQLGQPAVSLDQEGVALAGGRYRVVLRAEASDATAGIEQVNGSLALAGFDLDGTVSGTAPLSASPAQVSLSSGGAQALQLAGGPALAGAPYLVLGSASGVAPGLPVDGVVLPLVLDAYLLFTAENAGGAVYPGTLGLLDGGGAAAASIQVPAGTSPSLAGATLHHAFVALGPLGTASFASNPVPLALAP